MSAVRPRVLIVSRWPRVVTIARLPGPLARAGFAVAAVCPEESFLARTRFLARRFACPPAQHAFPAAVWRAVREWRPELIVPGEDWDAALLARLGASLPVRVLAPLNATAGRLRAAQGAPGAFDALRSKRALQRRAEALGLATPHDEAVASLDAARAYAARHDYPVVLKHEYASGGQGVRICADERALEDAYARMTRGRRRRRSPRRWARDVVQTACLVRGRGGRGTLSVQRYVEGDKVLHNFVAFRGRYLGGVTAEEVRRHPEPTGPCTVVRAVAHQEVDRAARRLVEQVGYTGFGCFDFIRERGTGRMVLLECNAIPCNVVHAADLLGHDLCAAFCDAVQGRPPVSASPAADRPLALFPQELRRDPTGALLDRCRHDVPHDDPALLKALARAFEVDPHRAERRVHAPTAS